MLTVERAEAGFKIKLACDTFRATGLTAYLEAGGNARKRPSDGSS
jgi:hypothetical protein